MLVPLATVAQSRRVVVERLAAPGGHTIEVSAGDSGVVGVTVRGGKFPLVAQASPESARRWVAQVNAIASATASAAASGAGKASPRVEFGHFSDILRYRRRYDAPARRDLIGVDVGPNNLTLYEMEVAPPLLGRLTASMLRAARITESLTSPATLLRAEGRSAASGRDLPNVRSKHVSTPSARCVAASTMPPLEYNYGASGYPPGTNLDKVIQPALRSGSPRPAYPRRALGARVTGEVVASFVVDTAGRPLVDSFRLRGPANPLFVESVCDALPQMQFVPRRLGGKLVNQLVQETFSIPPPAGAR